LAPLPENILLLKLLELSWLGDILVVGNTGEFGAMCCLDGEKEKCSWESGTFGPLKILASGAAFRTGTLNPFISIIV
jgi:hypothetical protein